MIIRLQDITKHYQVGPEQIRALDGVNLEIDRNEYVAIMGTIGSGKSTLMNILGCLDRPTAGTYELDGRRDHADGRGGAGARAQRADRLRLPDLRAAAALTALKNVELPLIYSPTVGGAGGRGRSRR